MYLYQVRVPVFLSLKFCICCCRPFALMRASSATTCAGMSKSEMFVMSMLLEVVAIIISISSRGLIILPTISRCKIVMDYSIDHISCPGFRMCSENVDFFVELKLFLRSLNLILKSFIFLPTYLLYGTKALEKLWTPSRVSLIQF